MSSYKKFVFKVLAAFLCNIVLGFYAVRYFVGELPTKSSIPESLAFRGFYCFLFFTTLTIATLIYSVRHKGRIDKQTSKPPLNLRLLTFVILSLHIPLALIYGLLLLFFGAESLIKLGAL